MHQLPIQVLYNICTTQTEMNHEKIYRFISSQNDSKSNEIYSLISILDCSKLPDEIVKECIQKKKRTFWICSM